MPDSPYRIYETRFDREVHARDLQPSSAKAWNDGDPHENSKLLPPDSGAALAEGLGEFDGEAIVLVDMSGSTRSSIPGVVSLVDGVALALEAKGAPFQVLGYTTTSWKGGESRKQWIEDGRPPHPGRLCDLLHVVFKTRDESWAETRDAFREAIRHGNLKENIDGEAIRWALSRLDRRDGARIVHVGDGSSVDDATLSVNPKDYLTDDYERAIAEADAKGVTTTLVEANAYPPKHPEGFFRPQRYVFLDYVPEGPSMAEAAIAAAFADAPAPTP